MPASTAITRNKKLLWWFLTTTVQPEAQAGFYNFADIGKK